MLDLPSLGERTHRRLGQVEDGRAIGEDHRGPPSEAGKLDPAITARRAVSARARWLRMASTVRRPHPGAVTGAPASAAQPVPVVRTACERPAPEGPAFAKVLVRALWGSLDQMS